MHDVPPRWTNRNVCLFFDPTQGGLAEVLGASRNGFLWFLNERRRVLRDAGERGPDWAEWSAQGLRIADDLRRRFLIGALDAYADQDARDDELEGYEGAWSTL